MNHSVTNDDNIFVNVVSNTTAITLQEATNDDSIFSNGIGNVTSVVLQSALWFKAWRIIQLTIFPIIGLVGVIFNILGSIILVKSGLHISSNCLLLGLAIADTLALLYPLNVPYMIGYFTTKMPTTQGVSGNIWELPYVWAKFCAITQIVLWWLSNYGLTMSTSITVFIVIERLIAVFLPLHFTRIVTTRRVWLAMFAAFLFWLPSQIIRGMVFEFYYTYDATYDAFYGSYTITHMYELFAYLYDNITVHIEETFALVFIVAGCVAISIKVGITMRARDKLTGASGSKSKSQTTKTLVAVCFIFAIMKFSLTISTTVGIRKETYVSEVATVALFGFSQCFVVLNSAGNFIVYVVINTKFRDIFLDIMHIKKRTDFSRNKSSMVQ